MLSSCTTKVLVAWIILHIVASSDDLDRGTNDELCSMCSCSNNEDTLDCSGRGLTELPEAGSTKVTRLNASFNEITMFPGNLERFPNLKLLDLSNNHLTMINSQTLSHLDQLEVLDLSSNDFKSWMMLNPNHAFIGAKQLRVLNLSHNKLGTMGNLDKKELFVSSSLEHLILEDCGIDSIHGRSPISGLANIKWLKLSNNPLRRIQNLVSPTLRSLDVSHCHLNFVHQDTLAFLPSLVNLQMAHNYRLVLTTPGTTLISDSLRYLDISHCNVMDSSIGGFPNIRKAVLSHNLIRFFSEREFVNNTKLEHLDLSYNSISSLKPLFFRGLDNLKYLDLSWNEIANIHEQTFADLSSLTRINLARNYLSEVGNLKSLSITSLDMSQCEINNIKKDALTGLQALVDLNLSRNLISVVPDGISSNTLQYFNLNYNRIGSITNRTFYLLPRLISLSLVGNRFTNVWKYTYFQSNPYLERIDLSDNMWRCDCADHNMRDFYEYLTLEPSKEESFNLLCNSPNIVNGETWFEACYIAWYPSQQTVTPNGLVWFLMCMIIAVSLCFLISSIIRRTMKRRMLAMQAERERQVEEARDRLRQMRMRAEQEALCNTPDPRDLVAPPSYDEALSMPKFNSSCHSLNEVGSGKSKRRRGRRKTKSSGDLLEETDRENETRVFEDLELSEGPEQNRRRRRRKSIRCGSQEIAELDRSPGTRRRLLSLYDDNNGVDIVTNVTVQADMEAPVRSRNRRNSAEDDDRSRESNF